MKRKRKEWAKHWQCDSEDKSWKNEKLRNLVKGLLQLTEESLQRPARSYKATTGVGCDGSHPRVPVDFSKETGEEVEKFLAKVMQ